MKKNYIFDLGNVLVHFWPREMTAAYVEDPADIDLIWPVVFDRLYWDPLDIGGISDEELKNACHQRLPERLWDKADAVYDHWQEHIPTIDGMPQLVKDIKARGGKVYLLSNISIGFTEKYRDVPELVELFELFDGLVFSGPLKFGKPDPAIFRYVLDKYDIHAGESVFIDDNAKNVESAQSVGITAILFQGDPAALGQQLGF